MEKEYVIGRFFGTCFGVLSSFFSSTMGASSFFTLKLRGITECYSVLVSVGFGSSFFVVSVLGLDFLG